MNLRRESKLAEFTLMFDLKFVSNLVEEKPVIFKIVPIGHPLCDVRPEKYLGYNSHGHGILFFCCTTKKIESVSAINILTLTLL